MDVFNYLNLMNDLSNNEQKYLKKIRELQSK